MDSGNQSGSGVGRQFTEPTAQSWQNSEDDTSSQSIANTVLVLDDDPSILASLDALLSAKGYRVRLHATFSDLKSKPLPTTPSCLLLDNQLGDELTGFQAFEELLAAGWRIPTIFLTANWNPCSIVKAMKAGAEGFIVKPFDPAELLDGVAKALRRSGANQQSDQKVADARALACLLTPREQQVVKGVMRGMLNKEIADDLGLALVTVKVHRGRAMQKLKAGNPAELVHLARLAGLTH